MAQTTGGSGQYIRLARTTRPVHQHSHLDFQLLVPLQGTIRMLIGDAAATVTPPQSLLLWPRVEHAMQGSPGGVDVLAVTIPEAVMTRARRELDPLLTRPDAGCITLGTTGMLITELVHQLVALQGSHHPRQLFDAALQHLAWMLAWRTASTDAAQDSDILARQHFQSDYVERAAQVLRQHHAQPWRMDRLARCVGTSARNLTRAFQLELGVPPSRYLALLRLQQAAHLLRTTRKTAGEIAGLVGYRNAAHFHTAFRERYRCTPAAYRLNRT